MSKPLPIQLHNTKTSAADISFSMLIDHHSPSNTDDNIATLSRIQSRHRSTWVDDSLVLGCFSCKIQFGFYVRTHHCRKCGNVFCHKCSNNWMEIPEQVGNIPSEPNNLKNNLSKLVWSTTQVRVCNDCARELRVLKSLVPLFKIFDLVPITIHGYRNMRLVSKTWHKLANYYLSIFRELQYKLPYQEYSTTERRMLTANKKLFFGHSQWLLALLKVGDTLKNSSKLANCNTLMCSRNCKSKLTAYEAVTVLESCRNDQHRLGVILEVLDETGDDEFCIYISLLIQEMICQADFCSRKISKFLIQRSKRSIKVAGRVYWGCKIIMDNTILTVQQLDIFQSCHKRLLHELDDKTVGYLENSESLVLFLNSLTKHSKQADIRLAFDANKNLFTDLRIPTAPHLICKRIVVEKICVKDSASKPIFMPIICYNELTRNTCQYYLLYKFEDVRQDQIVLDTISMMDIILKKELRRDTKSNVPMQIITYNIFPTSATSGLIEIIPNCHTLFEIQKKFTIFNYILENNKGSGHTADDLRSRFLQSCAAYCVITYLLGVGDRHLENIMVSEEGYLFHIDYGFVMGADPKLLQIPSMRITSDMVDALGGAESNYYKEFILLAKNIHLCLQKRLPTFYTLLCLLVTIQPSIKRKLTKEGLINELTRRFMYGETFEQSESQLSIQISNSSGSYNHTLIDFFHYHSKENTVSNLFSWIGSLF